MPRASPINVLSKTVKVEEESSTPFPITPESTPKRGKSITDFFINNEGEIIEDTMSPAARRAIEEEQAMHRKRAEQGKGRKTSIPISPTAKQRYAHFGSYPSDSDEDEGYVFGPEPGSPSARKEKARTVSNPKAMNRGNATSNSQSDWDVMMVQRRKNRAAALEKMSKR